MRHASTASPIIRIDQLVTLEKDKYRVERTTAVEKLLPSIINSVFVFGLMTPVLVLYGPGIVWKWSVVACFGLYELMMFRYFKDRCFGMKIFDTYYRSAFKSRNHLLYTILYTLSFSTFLIYFWFPLDLLLINILCIQLPFVLFTGTTLHGYVSGVETVKIVAK